MIVNFQSESLLQEGYRIILYRYVLSFLLPCLYLNRWCQLHPDTSSVFSLASTKFANYANLVILLKRW